MSSLRWAGVCLLIFLACEPTFGQTSERKDQQSIDLFRPDYDLIIFVVVAISLAVMVILANSPLMEDISKWVRSFMTSRGVVNLTSNPVLMEAFPTLEEKSSYWKYQLRSNVLGDHVLSYNDFISRLRDSGVSSKDSETLFSQFSSQDTPRNIENRLVAKHAGKKDEIRRLFAQLRSYHVVEKLDAPAVPRLTSLSNELGKKLLERTDLKFIPPCPHPKGTAVWFFRRPTTAPEKGIIVESSIPGSCKVDLGVNAERTVDADLVVADLTGKKIVVTGQQKLIKIGKVQLSYMRGEEEVKSILPTSMPLKGVVPTDEPTSMEDLVTVQFVRLDPAGLAKAPFSMALPRAVLVLDV